MHIRWQEAAYVGSLAVLGAYIRIVLQESTPGQFTNYLWAQFLGSFILGLCQPFREEFNADLFVGVGVGLCGSVTSFSSWQGQIAQGVMLRNSTTNNNVLAYQYLQDQMVGFAVPFAALKFGFAVGVVGFWPPSPPCSELVADFVVPFGLMVGAIVGLVIGTIWLPSHIAFSLCFAPIGALGRLALARQWNAPPTQVWGTVAANLLGTAIWGAMWDVNQVTGSATLPTAVQDGFCGSLTTVSTFVWELSQLTDLSALRYALGSITAAQVVLFAIMGGVGW
ncbi:hypothetical protein BASA81_005886 [Batrachochytrium salamandrivorans]|nr:hypothetical protein BASA81_005886 [Batrachochytrium salamandrivorans]